MKDILSDIKVVELSTAAAGPFCGEVLIEYGADVVLVETVKGVETRGTPQFAYMNSGKKPIAINLKTESGKEAMFKLLETADVFLSNYRYRALVKLGLSYEELEKRFPKLIYAYVTGYGDTGAMKDDPGFDNTAFWCKSGLLNDMADSSCNPVLPPTSPSGVGDIMSGTVLALGVIAAIRRRDKTGKGGRVRTSLLNMGLYCNFSQMFLSQYGTKYPKTRYVPNRALSNSYAAKDGWIYLITLNFQRDFPKLITALGRPDLVGDPRWQNIHDTEGQNNPDAQALCRILEECFSKFTIAELKKIFDDIQMALGIYSSTEDALKDQQAWDNGFLYRMTNWDGKEVVAPAYPVLIDDAVPMVRTDPGALGSYTRECMQGLGYSDAEIEAMMAEGAIR